MLAHIRARQGKTQSASAEELARVQSYIAEHTRSAGPRSAEDAHASFCERARALASTLDEVRSRTEIPRAVGRYLNEHGLSGPVVCWPELIELDWAASGIEVAARSANAADLVGITGAYCAVAETGTLVTLSGAHTQPSVSLLPETHIALLQRSRIVSTMEDAWALIRAEHGSLPRAVNFISGPSRTADIEQTVTLGAHGPYRVHIVVVAE